MTSRRQFRAVYDQGARVRGSRLTLFGLPNDLGHIRLGITVTRKVGGAVRRNRIKRMLREIFRQYRGSNGVGIDVVVNAHPGIHQVDYRQLETDFTGTLARLVRRIAT